MLFRSPRSWQAQNVGKKLAEGKGNFANAERLLNELIASLEESRLQAGADMYRPLLDSAFAPARMKIDDIFTIARNTDKSTACGEAEKLIQRCINDYYLYFCNMVAMYLVIRHSNDIFIMNR